jgi:hypothetical protein
MSTKENINDKKYSKKPFLDVHYSEGNVTQHHKDVLGTDIPEGYFKSSKKKILDLVKEETPKKQKVYRLQPRFRYAIAASVAVLLSVTIWLQVGDTIDANELHELSDDTLINSLFIEDTDLDTFTNDVLVSEVMVKAELSEQNLENTFINSLFVEDSLLDDYMGKSLLENMVL